MPVWNFQKMSTHDLKNMVIEINSMMPALKGDSKFQAGIKLKMARGELKNRQAGRQFLIKRFHCEEKVQ